MSAADEIVKRHDELFGEGSWAQLEKEVYECHPYLKEFLAQCNAELEALDETKSKRWWEFWK